MMSTGYTSRFSGYSRSIFSVVITIRLGSVGSDWSCYCTKAWTFTSVLRFRSHPAIACCIAIHATANVCPMWEQ